MRAILTYHSIDDSGSPISIDARAFKQHMRFLAAGRPRVVPLSQIAGAPDESVALTFDDAFANFADVALPVLADLGLPATLFVVSDHVGGQNDWEGYAPSTATIPTLPLMTWAQLRAAKEHGIEIGAHTRRHPYLTSLSSSQLADELEGGAERIRNELGERPVAFAYPYGDLDGSVVEAVGRCYSTACTTELRALAPGEDALRLPRLDAYYLRATGALEQWGTSSFQRRLWIRAQARRVRRLVTPARTRA
jgi:peptidoglycan/xylan/chitin deacetylase (PgdA/CDA1 family)